MISSTVNWAQGFKTYYHPNLFSLLNGTEQDIYSASKWLNAFKLVGSSVFISGQNSAELSIEKVL